MLCCYRTGVSMGNGQASGGKNNEEGQVIQYGGRRSRHRMSIISRNYRPLHPQIQKVINENANYYRQVSIRMSFFHA